MGGINIRVSKNFKKIIDRIRKQEIERGNKECTYPTATEILYKRIMRAGGLRNDK